MNRVGLARRHRSSPPGGRKGPLRERYGRKPRAWATRARRLCDASLDELEPWVRPKTAPRFRRGAAVGQHHVGREVVRAADQRRADAVGGDGNAPFPELADLLDGDPAGDDDLDPLESVAVERIPDLADEPL